MRHVVNTWLVRAPTQRRRVTRVNFGCDTVTPSAKMFECKSYRRGPTQLTFVSIIGVVIPLVRGDVVRTQSVARGTIATANSLPCGPIFTQGALFVRYLSGGTSLFGQTALDCCCNELSGCT
jgi:hypothetical protein